MSQGQPARDYIASVGQQVSDYLRTLFNENAVPSVLFRAMNYSLLSDGKRLRPVLCIAAAECLGAARNDVMPVAASLELIHCYSLIHDDLPTMDDDDLRRGQPTNHKVFGEATALLAGDGLLTYAFELLSHPLPIPAERQLKLVGRLAQAAGVFGMVGGQQADILAEHMDAKRDVLEYIHVHKTAKLLQAAVLMGGLFAGASHRHLQALETFGMKLGLAFQMMDDWLDVAGDETVIGKQVGSDERLDKLTYVRFVGLDETRRLAGQSIADAVRALRDADIDAPILESIADFVVQRQK